MSTNTVHELHARMQPGVASYPLALAALDITPEERAGLAMLPAADFLTIAARAVQATTGFDGSHIDTARMISPVILATVESRGDGVRQ